MKPTRIIEICANSAQSCVEAEAGGAKRVELCAGIPEAVRCRERDSSHCRTGETCGRPHHHHAGVRSSGE